MVDLPSPVAHSEVRLAMRRAMRANKARPKQARGLTCAWLERIIGACPDDLAGKRDAAIICVGYDSLARSYELSLLEVEHVSRDCETILIPRSKTDPSGEGRLERFPHVLTRRGFPCGRGSDSSLLLDAGGQHGWHGRFHRTFGIGSLLRLTAA